MKKGDSTTDITITQMAIRDYYVGQIWYLTPVIPATRAEIRVNV
jgi:hypothetical protein